MEYRTSTSESIAVVIPERVERPVAYQKLDPDAVDRVAARLADLLEEEEIREGAEMKEIQLWVEWTIGDGNLDAFRSIVTEGNLRVRDEEPGAVSVRSFFSEDGKKCHLFECYQDVDAALAHISGGAVAEVLPKLAALAEMTRLEAHGELSDELSELLKSFGCVAYAGADGFTR